MIAIHIGLKKSGSASIQSFLVANEEALRRQGINYPRLGRGKFKAHGNLAAEMVGGTRFRPREGSLAELADQWNDTQSTVNLISSEMFEECESTQIARAKAIFDRNRQECRIILVMRDLAFIMPSSYAQKIKHGNHVFDFDSFFEQRVAERRTNYFMTAERWAAVFGWDNLRIRLLDPLHMVNGDLIDDFLGALGFDPNSEPMRALERPGPVNVAPGWRVLEATRALLLDRHGLPPDHPLLRIEKAPPGAKRMSHSVHVKKFATTLSLAGDRLGWNDDKGLYLTRRQAQDCLDLYRSTIARFNEVLSAPLPMPASLDERGFKERPWLPSVEHIEPDQLRAFYHRAAKLLIKRGGL